jgi:hypothetical protein
MRTILHRASLFSLLSLAFSGAAVGGCSGSPESDPALLAADDQALGDESSETVLGDQALGQAEQAQTGRRGRGHHGGHHHHPPSGESCEAAGQKFPDGSAVPSGDSCNSCACNDGAVVCTLALCEPVFCAAFVEEPDGVCGRFPLDPCIAQDPDCNQPLEPTAP